MSGPFTLEQIATRLGGRIAGPQDVLIHQVGSLERAGPGQIAFLSNPGFRGQLAGTGASAVILAADAEGLTALPRIVCEDPYVYFARVSQLFNPRITQAVGVHPSASIATSAMLGARVSIGPGCCVGDERSHLFVRTVTSQRDVMGPALGIGRQLCQHDVNPTPLRCGRMLSCRSREQRMGWDEAITVDPHEAGIQRVVDSPGPTSVAS